MAQIPFIEDAYIDDVIKSSGAYDPTLNLTQGVKLRELIKLMRDGIAEGTSGGSGNPVTISVKYAELVNLINSGALVAGQQYLLTDFQSTFVYSVYDTTDINHSYLFFTDEVYSGNIEPLLLTALSNVKLSSIAKSVLYPNDEILYSYQNKNGGILSSTKGTILSREDKLMLAYANFDWREVKYKYNDENGTPVISKAVTFGANTHGISNSKVFAFGTYGVVGAIVINYIYNSTVSSVSNQIVVGNVIHSNVRGCSIVNKSFHVENSILKDSINATSGKPYINVNGLEAVFTNASIYMDENVLLDLGYDGSNPLNIRLIPGPIDDVYYARIYKQFVDVNGVFQTVPLNNYEV